MPRKLPKAARPLRSGLQAATGRPAAEEGCPEHLVPRLDLGLFLPARRL